MDSLLVATLVCCANVVVFSLKIHIQTLFSNGYFLLPGIINFHAETNVANAGVWDKAVVLCWLTLLNLQTGLNVLPLPL